MRNDAFETLLAVMHETGRKVATSGTGDSVKMIVDCGRRRRIRLYAASRLARFSTAESTLNPCRSELNCDLGIARQKISPLALLYQTSESPSVMMKTFERSKIARVS